LFRKIDRLDRPLFKWSRHDPYTRRELLRSVLCLGGASSGKTSGTNRHFAKVIAANADIGALWLASKPEEKQWLIKIFAEAGALHRLLIMEPGGTLEWNYLKTLGSSFPENLQLPLRRCVAPPPAEGPQASPEALESQYQA
jgi:hypothetical protein